MVMTTKSISAAWTLDTNKKIKSNSLKSKKKKNVITAKAPTIKVKPTTNNWSTPVPKHLQSNGRHPRNPNAVPGKAGITHKNPVGPRMAPKLYNSVPGNKGITHNKPVGPNYNTKKPKTLKQTNTTGSPRGHYATRMAQGLLNRPTSKSAMNKLYKK